MWGDGWNGVCGAKTRKGTPCKCLALKNGKCKYHGGMSTGPRTPEGIRRALMNLKQYRDKYVATEEMAKRGVKVTLIPDRKAVSND